MSNRRIVCVLGMHRSGTSLVANLLHALGLDLGPEEHLMRPSPANPAGHWESKPIKEINDEILSRLGGSWSRPPEFAAGWEKRPELDELRGQARELIEEDFPASDSWAFKDPRLCLTLPFWQHILPQMRYVICLRNPMDVAFSLKARDEEPLEFEPGLALWLTYVRAALAATAGHAQRIIFYEDLMMDPEPVVRQLAGFVGIDNSDAGEAYVRAAIRVALSKSLWHHRTTVSNVVDEPRLPFHIKALYLALRLFSPGAESLGIEVLDLLGAHAVDAGRQSAEFEQRLSERRADLDRIVKSRAEERRVRQELEAERQVARAELRAEARLRREVEAELEARSAELEQLQAPLPDPEEAPTASAGARAAYEQLVDDVRARARELIPSEATVLVASKGDDALLQIDGCRGWHFPIAADGRYGGHHPAGDTAVIAQLEAMRASGADHLLLPATTLWWLDHYHGFRRHLEDRYVPLLEDEKCAIYRLSAGDREDVNGSIEALKRAVVSLRVRSGRDPSVLDWYSELGIADRLPEIPVFAPPGEGDRLPYLDQSVDIVVLASADAAQLREARRVAAGAVIRIDPSFREAAELEWLAGGRTGWGEDVSVALLPGAEGSAWDTTLGAFAETLNEGFAGELVVIGDPTTLESARERAAAAGSQIRLIEVSAGASFAERARAATEATDHSFQVFVTAPAVPLPDWLPSIRALFSRNRETGVVGTRILSRLGALEEAGGILAADGSRRRRGEGDQDPDRPAYCFVRRVDFCSEPLLATRRDLFTQLGGFDNGGVAAADRLVEFSLRAGQAGASIYYQPQARVVRIGDTDR